MRRQHRACTATSSGSRNGSQPSHSASRVRLHPQHGRHSSSWRYAVMPSSHIHPHPPTQGRYGLTLPSHYPAATRLKGGLLWESWNLPPDSRHVTCGASGRCTRTFGSACTYRSCGRWRRRRAQLSWRSPAASIRACGRTVPSRQRRLLQGKVRRTVRRKVQRRQRERGQ